VLNIFAAAKRLVGIVSAISPMDLPSIS